MFLIVALEAILLGAASAGLFADFLWTALALLASSHAYIMRKEGKADERENTLALAKGLLAMQNDGISMAHAAHRSESTEGRPLRQMVQGLRLGGIRIRKMGSMEELAAIAERAVAKGRHMNEELGLFCSRLSREIEEENARTSLIGGMRSLSYAGIAFFVPLLGGISSSILGYVGLKGASEGFRAVIWLYTMLLLGITSLFESPGKGILARAYRTMPLAVAATAALVASSALLSNI